MDLTELRDGLRPPCPVIDVHTHPPGDFGYRCETVHDDVEALLGAADRAGVAKMCLFSVGRPALQHPTIAQCRTANDDVLTMRDLAPDRFLPFCFLTPDHPQESVAEMDRCVGEHGFVGVKLWVARRASDPGLDPILRRAVELNVPVLQHAWRKTTGNLPGESFPADVAVLARRHPAARIIMAHLNGCGLRGLEDVADCPNVVVDTSGGDPESGIVEAAVAALGPRRVLNASDTPIRHLAVSIGKTVGADLPLAVKRDILYNNAARILPPTAGLEPLEPHANDH